MINSMWFKRSLLQGDIVIVVRDLKAKLESDTTLLGRVMRKHSLRDHSNNDDRLSAFCTYHRLTISDILVENRARNNLVVSTDWQIDHTAVNSRLRSCFWMRKSREALFLASSDDRLPSFAYCIRIFSQKVELSIAEAQHGVTSSCHSKVRELFCWSDGRYLEQEQ